MSCVIVECKSHSGRKTKQAEHISWHRLPIDPDLRQKWIEAIGRINWQFKKHHRLCSKHFTKDCFYFFDQPWRKLKLNAVPTLLLRSNTNVLPKTSTGFDAVQQQEDLILRVSKLEKDVEKLKKVATQRLLKIDALRHKTKRLEKKNSDLNSRLTDLLKNEKIETESLMLLDSVKGNPVIKRYLGKQMGDNTREFSLELKKNAVKLNYLSPRAYAFVRSELKEILPH